MRRAAPFVACVLAACGARTNIDVVSGPAAVTVEQDDGPVPLACSTSFARCKERHSAPITVSTASEVVTEFVGDIAAIDAQRLLVAYRPTGLRDVELAVVGPDGAIVARQRVRSSDVKPRLTFHPGFATGVLRTANTTTVLDAEGRPTVATTLPAADVRPGTPIIPISSGYLAWASDARGSRFYRARASSRGLEWESDRDAVVATELEVARRTEGLPRAFVMTDGRAATVYHLDDDGRATKGHDNTRTARGFLLGAVETERGIFALINPLDVGPVSLVDMENDTTIDADGATFGDVLSLDDQSIVVATAAGDGDITLRALATGASAFGDGRTVAGAGQAAMLRMAPTRTGFAMIWMGTATPKARPSLFYQRWDCCPG